MLKETLILSMVVYATTAISFGFTGLGDGLKHNDGIGASSYDKGLHLNLNGGGSDGGFHFNLGGDEILKEKEPEEQKYYKDFDYYAKPHYEFKYAVHDPKHKDFHEQKEKRIGDKVVGEYSIHDPDGTIRIVKYEADKENGFNAIVERKGHAQHPQHYKTYHH